MESWDIEKLNSRKRAKSIESKNAHKKSNYLWNKTRNQEKLKTPLPSNRSNRFLNRRENADKNPTDSAASVPNQTRPTHGYCKGRETSLHNQLRSRMFRFFSPFARFEFLNDSGIRVNEENRVGRKWTGGGITRRLIYTILSPFSSYWLPRFFFFIIRIYIKKKKKTDLRTD